MSLEKVETVDIFAPPAYPTVMQTDTPQKSNNRKYVIAAVVTVVLVVIVTGAVLGGTFLQNQHTETLVKEFTLTTKDKDGKVVKEKIKIDAKNNEEEITADNGKLHVLEDYSRGITVMRTTIKKYACYLKPLNKSGIVDPKASKEYMDSIKPSTEIASNQTVDEDVSQIVYEPSEDRIEDKSFLSARAQELCEGLDVYWMLPTERKQDKGRSKRAVCFYRTYRLCYTRYICTWYGCFYRRYCYYVRRIYCRG